MLLIALQMPAATVDPAAALAKARQCLASLTRGDRNKAPSAIEPRLVLTRIGDNNTGQATYYIFNTDDAFIIVAGDDRAEEILAIGDHPLDVGNIPDNMQSLLNSYSDQINYLLLNPDLQVSKPYRAMGAATVEPLLTAMWDQKAPFYDQCVMGGFQCLTGCPATSSAIVFHYWKYPVDPTPPVPGYQCQVRYSYLDDDLMIDVPELPSVTFDWDNMLDSYTDGYTAEQGDAVATLMRYIGQSERMVYGTPETYGSGLAIDSMNNIAQMFIHFGYDPQMVRLVKKTSNYVHGQELVSDAEWADIILEELYERRPIVFTADSRVGGHAFNVDGYNAATNLYHVNFGWSGNGNGDFALNAFYDGLVTYNEYQQIIVGIQPPTDGPALSTSTHKISFEGFIGETVTQTFTVGGSNLTGDVTLTIEDENGVFATDTATVSDADAQGEGQEVSVTFSPQSMGEYNAIMTLTSPGARPTVVRLVATAALRKHDPVLLEPTEVGSTSFRAIWTDETPASNVAGYTLVVQQVGDAQAEEIATADFSSINYTGLELEPLVDYESYCTPSGWAGTDIYCDKNGVRLGYSNDQPVGSLITAPLDLSHSAGKLTITFNAKNYGGGTGSASLVFTNGTHSVSQSLKSTAKTYTVVLDCDAFSGETVTITSSNRRVLLTNVSITTTDINESAMLAPVEQGDATSRVITGIHDKYYTVTDLIPGAAYFFRVKAIYGDDTESHWTASALVELLQDKPQGDVNGDGKVDGSDLNILINVVLGKDNADGYDGRANIDGTGAVDGSDINTLINILLNK